MVASLLGTEPVIRACGNEWMIQSKTHSLEENLMWSHPNCASSMREKTRGPETLSEVDNGNSPRQGSCLPGLCEDCNLGEDDHFPKDFVDSAEKCYSLRHFPRNYPHAKAHNTVVALSEVFLTGACEIHSSIV